MIHHRWPSPLLFSSLIPSVFVLIGCGGNVIVDGVAAGSGATGGAGAASGTASSTGSTPSTGSSSSTGAGAGPPIACSAKTGCSADQFCDYKDNYCGVQDGTGVCTPRPASCAPSPEPACGCDGKVHPGPCDTESSGVDVSVIQCPPPPGMFQCGFLFCTMATQYCEHLIVDQSSSGEIDSCKPFPPCGPTCDCLFAETCVKACSGESDDGIDGDCHPGG